MKIYVLILPMRNGNVANILKVKMLIISSYPTYEEWKRNDKQKQKIETKLFLSYL